LLITLQWAPEAQPICSPENNVQDRVSSHFIKDNIIPASPDSPTHGSHTHPDQTLSHLMPIVKPSTKHMVYRSRLGQICSKEDNLPNHFSKGALEEEVLDSFILIATDTFLTPFPVRPSEVVLC
jgi:hypothetical protein